jgi:hypothetical protein
MAVESKLYGAPVALEHEAVTPFVILYDGKREIRSLWRTLLCRQAPVIEVVSRDPTDDTGRVLARSRIAIPEKELFGRSLGICLQRQRALLDLAERRSNREPWKSGEKVPIEGAAVSLSSFLVLAFVAHHVFLKLWNQILKPFVRRDHWQIEHRTLAAGRDGSAMRTEKDALLERDAWSAIPSPDGRFYADPFLWLGEPAQRHLFFEDFSYEADRAVIRHMRLDEAADVGRVVLERPYHLSYPFLFRHQEQVYMIPETARNKTIEAYRAEPFPFVWVLHKVLMTGVMALDTTLYHDGTTWWMFTTLAEEGGSTWDELSLFFSDDPFGTWQPHPMNPVISDCRSARMAGNLFRDASGRLVRPAQDCERSYGAALVLCEVVECTKESYRERALTRQSPPSGCQGIHTWNVAGNTAVTDVKRSRWK